MALNYRIQSGHILIYHLFDIADEIDLDKLRHLWAGQASDIRLVSRRASVYYMQFDKAPLLLPMGKRDLMLEDESWHRAEVRAKVFDFGVVSISWQIPMHESWQQLGQEAHYYIDSDKIAQQSRSQLEDLLPALHSALKRPYENILMEDYTVFYVQNFEASLNAQELLSEAGHDIASLLRGESKPLSPSECQNVMEQRLSYFEDDLVVITWNATFVYDPEGSQEHVDIIEFANGELLELRSYDQILDDQLEQIYDALEGLPKKRWSTLFRNPYQVTIQKLLTLLIEVSELTDRLENSLKIIGDLYCARIHRHISTVLHLQEWQSRVDGKLDNAHKIYETLNSEIAERRTMLLEIIVVILILTEILMAFFPH